MKKNRNTLESNILSMLSKAVIAVFLFMAISPMSFGQDDKKKAEEQKKLAKAEAEALKKQAKREQRYGKIKAFALEKYGADPEFKNAVDDRYREVRSEHVQYAYLVNMTPPNAKLVWRDGEKIRVNQALYDNPLAQDYVNRVGQSLVPSNSTKLYSFKILQNPVPESKSLSSGTVYITLGLLSIIDNEAQLAYILGHEIAHIEKDHWFDDILVDLGTKPYQDKKEAGMQFLRALARVAAQGSIVQIAAASVVKAYDLDGTFQWETFHEDEADIESMKFMFQRNYDVREIPKFYARMRDMTKDPRSQTGFVADPDRINDRLEEFNRSSGQYNRAGSIVGAVDLSQSRAKNLRLTGSRGVARMLNETLAPEIQKKLENEELIASSEEFQSTMSLVKRDNGIRALQFDMFQLARNNLDDSLSIRSNDPFAYYYYGKAVKQTARNASEVSMALQNLNQAISFDKRQTLAEPYLFRAMLRLGERNPNEVGMIANDLRKYVEIYQRENKGELPPNMEFVYDFMQDLEVLDYRASPAYNNAEAPKAIFGSQPPTGPVTSAPVVNSPPAVVNPAQAPTPVKKPVKKP